MFLGLIRGGRPAVASQSPKRANLRYGGVPGNVCGREVPGSARPAPPYFLAVKLAGACGGDRNPLANRVNPSWRNSLLFQGVGHLGVVVA